METVVQCRQKGDGEYTRTSHPAELMGSPTADSWPFVRTQDNAEGCPALDHPPERPHRIGPALPHPGYPPHPVWQVFDQRMKDASVS